MMKRVCMVSSFAFLLACSQQAENLDSVTPLLKAANFFEAFTTPSDDEGFCSIWKKGESDAGFFRSFGGFEKHEAIVNYAGSILTLRSEQSARFGSGEVIVYKVDGYPDNQILLETRQDEFGSFSGIIMVQRLDGDETHVIGGPVAVEGLCAG